MDRQLDDGAWDALQSKLGASFLQTSGWAAFQTKLGVPVRRFAGDDWSALCLEYGTGAGKYWLLPYGPTFVSDRALADALAQLKAAAHIAGVSWLRIEPLKPVNDLQKIEPKAVRTKNINPEFTVCNDLTEDEAAIRSRLTPNKRNLINRGTKRGLRFETSADPGDINIFVDMLREVEKRTGSHSHGGDYFVSQAEILIPRGAMVLNIARGPEDQPLATTVLHKFGGTISRTYAGSYPEARKFEAGVGLDWYTMLRAKQDGLETFDFYGAAAPDAPADHPWSGFTKYKKEFGGEIVQHGGTWDIPLSPKRYRLYQTLRAAKKRLS